MADNAVQGDGVEEHVGALPPEPQPLQDELHPGDADRRIPIVDTIESALDLPPNWNTRDLPVRPGEVDQNLPPLPPSLGSVSGQASIPDLDTHQREVETWEVWLEQGLAVFESLMTEATSGELILNLPSQRVLSEE